MYHYCVLWKSFLSILIRCTSMCTMNCIVESDGLVYDASLVILDDETLQYCTL